MAHSIGLDVGHSAVKVAADGFTAVIPSAATEAMDLSTEPAKSAAKDNLVTVDGKKWLVGDPAITHTFGRLSDGLRDDWVTTPEYAALVKAGYSQATHAIGSADATLAVGLPSRLFLAQEKRLVEVVSSVTGVRRENILAYPQPLAAFFVQALDADGKIVEVKDGKDALKHAWAIIDIGYYTTDFGFVENSIWSEAGSRSIQGVSAMAEQMLGILAGEYGFDASVRLCDDALRARSIRFNGKVIDLSKQVDTVTAQFAANVIERAERVFASYLSTSEGVLVVGGGADLVFDAMKRRWDHARVPQNARFAVAEGLRRAGLNFRHGDES